MTSKAFMIREEARAELRAATADCRALAPEVYDRALEQTGRYHFARRARRSISQAIVAVFVAIRAMLGLHG